MTLKLLYFLQNDSIHPRGVAHAMEHASAYSADEFHGHGQSAGRDLCPRSPPHRRTVDLH